MEDIFKVLIEINKIKLQRKTSSVPVKDFNSLPKKDYPFLYDNNEYFNLLQYVQEDVEFEKVFTNDLQLQMGIFAYTDSTEKYLRYLYGKQDLEKDILSNFDPHFYLPSFSFNRNDNNLVPIKVKNYRYFMDLAYYLRNLEITVNNIDFINTLNDSDNNKSQLEEEFNLIYVSSGEMDFFTLALFLFSFKEHYKDNEALLFEKENWDKILRAANIDYSKLELKLPHLNKKLFLDKWFSKFGLITKTGEISERGGRLIFWVNNLKNSDLYRFFSDKDRNRINVKTLKNVCDTIIYLFSDLKDIINKSRFNVVAHFCLRYDQGYYETEQLSRSWLVFPVLYDENNKAVGFFIGTFRDVITIDNIEVGIFEHTNGNEKGIPKEVRNLFNKQKLLIKAISEVEDNEIYFRGIIKEIEKEKEYSNRLKAIENSISKVMARNQSHNIGSHVLSRMVQPDDIDIFNILLGRKPKYLPIGKSLREQVKTEVNKLLNSKSSCNFSQKRKAYSEEQKKYYNKLISYFFSYLKTRQDLLADIVSGVPQVQSAKLFKKEVLKGIDDNRLLLNRISGVEDFKYRFKIEIAKSLGDDVAMAFANDIMGQHAFYIILENIIRNTAKHGASKSQKEEYVFTICVKESEIDPTHYQISIYDDIKIEGDTYLKLKTDLGIFKPESSIEFNDETIKINDVDILITKICENNAFEAKNDATNEFTNAFLKRANDYPDELEYLGSKDEYDYFKISKIDHLVTLQNIWINKKILDEDTFDLRQQALGLIEMETCTAYLRRIEISKIQAPEFLLEFDKQGKEKLVEAIKKGEKKLRLLRAVRPLKKENGNKEYEKYLGYRFYIPKPKELLIIDEIGDLWDKCLEKGKENDKYSHFKTLESKGVLLLNAKKGLKKTKENKHWVFDEGLVYQHSIMLLNLEKKPSFNNNDVKLPKRYVSCAEVKRCFNEYKTKFETHTINVQGNEKKFCSIVSYKLFSDFVIEKIVDDISMLLVETWRTYMHTKLKSLSLKCFNDNMNYFNELLPDNNQTNKYNIGYSAHGTKIEKGKDVFIVYETKFNQPMKVFSKRPKKSTELIPSFKMMDAMLTNTLVLDERIQKLANNEYTLQDKNNTKISYSEIWNLMNVYIPKSDEIQLGVKEFDVSYSCKIYKLLDKYKKNTIKKFSFIIIHLGIIEKILVAKPNNSKNDTSIKKFLDKLAQYSEAKIIITSGRAPQNLPNNYSFISYSLLSQYLIENRFKLYLNEVLNFSRPKI